MKILEKIPIYNPYFSGLEKEYIDKAIDDKWISANGPFVKQFEKEFANYIGSKYAVSVCNGTCALYLAVQVSNYYGKNKYIIPDFCYIAVANSVRQNKGTFLVGDVDRNTFSLKTDDLKFYGKTIDATIYVHTYSEISDVEEIKSICEENELFFIEDACEAFGCKFKDKYLGTYGDIGCFSFFGNKTITTGEGGMVVTDNEDIYKLLLLLRSQGVDPNANTLNRYDHLIIGNNFRMTNMQAAIGLAQLQSLNEIKKKKNAIYDYYRGNIYSQYLFDKNPYITENKDNFINWLFCIKTSDKIKMIEYLNSMGIETRSFFKPISSFDFYNYSFEKFPNSYYLYECGINIPSYPDLSESQLDYICKTINESNI